MSQKDDCFRPFKINTQLLCACKGSDANAVAESFKAKQIVDAGIADEFGLVTAEWTENEFDALCENYPVVSVIRLAK